MPWGIVSLTEFRFGIASRWSDGEAVKFSEGSSPRPRKWERDSLDWLKMPNPCSIATWDAPGRGRG